MADKSDRKLSSDGRSGTAGSLFEKLSRVRDAQGRCPYSRGDVAHIEELAGRIIELKRRRNAVILTHTYAPPEIIYTVGDFAGDSYYLSKMAAQTAADVIVFCGVRFMAETAKILSPSKTILLTASDGGCTLADCIDAPTVRALRGEYPDHTFVCYINTSAAIKALCDVCVTSANVFDIVRRIENEKIYFFSDRLMGENLVRELDRLGDRHQVRYFSGSCYVHEQFTPAMIDEIRARYPGVTVLCHPECAPAVVGRADAMGSTSQIEKMVAQSAEKRFFILSECGLIARLQIEHPDKEFVGPSFVCKYMKTNALDSVLRVLSSPRGEEIVEVDENVRKGALDCINAMFRYAEGPAR